MTSRPTNELRYHDLGTKLIEEFPELEDAYQEEIGWDETAGPHIIYGDVLTPYIIRLLESGDNPEVVKRAFDLLEAMCGHEDIHVQEVAVVTVLERLQGTPEWLELMKPYLGPLCKRAVRDLAQFWRGELLDL